MKTLLRPMLSLFVVLSVITGLVYPLVVTGIGRAAFPREAAGSLIYKDGKAVGSSLIGQNFDEPKYFWGRLSATAPMPNNGTASGGSNFGPLNPALADAVKGRIAALRAADPSATLPVPADLVTASASGLDPEISPAAADYQVARVAKARGLTPDAVRSLVARYTEGRQWGIFGEARVNVLKLNLALDGLAPGSV
ncbi:potassium-transporting ATPase subunit KdpC [Pandoraea apista]|uniref:Potassium-transporting ATPase KdpC subunit n=1 Tax=Pandoraea apista TaxID=93218 RepID=A0A0G4JME8_9BURK|nr:potassium-transporting ATPase subunit KdpC [Pandoraea apista]ALS64735.1 potassium-transporting ATPase subunit C [Pandoraea apista]AVF41319.1 potassium-transporting ATPase subunit KdpC [Pandoraea apista]OXS92188.1 potassium-transporting ATPase subunit C [Pandoraea apista]PTE01219.1 potassium-transporting ATPase subunit KdpC [Pandoraea apista]RRJ27748.1 potassium-transporting ATPase subunit KdpC [Pandoraea apista]